MVPTRRPTGKPPGVPEPWHLLPDRDGGSKGPAQGCGTLSPGGGGWEVGKHFPVWYPKSDIFWADVAGMGGRRGPSFE